MSPDRGRMWGRLVASAMVAVVSWAIGVGGVAAADGAVDGLFTVRWADPMPGERSGPDTRTEFRLTTVAGKTYDLKIPAAKRGEAIAAFGRRVTVRGRTLEAAAVSPAGRPVAESLVVDDFAVAEAADPSSATAAPEAPVIKRLLIVLVRFKDDDAVPHAPGFYKALANPLVGNETLRIPATINGYYQKTSSGRLGWKADVAGKGGLGAPSGWFALPHNLATYDGDIDWIAADALNLVEAAGIDVTHYHSLSFVTSNDFGRSAKGGGYVHRGRSYGATWIPPWAQEAETYVHELGHSLGLPHSGWLYEDYDSPWDDMSLGSAAREVKCGSYSSARRSYAARDIYCKEPGGGFIAMHKQRLGWIPAANIVTVAAPSTRTVVLEANALPLGSAKKMVKICIPGKDCTGTKARYLTVEARLRVDHYERGLPGEGILIHDVMMNRAPIGTNDACYYNDQSGWAVPIDATPGDWDSTHCDPGRRTLPNYGLYNAQFKVGSRYEKASWGIRVEVLSRTTRTITVRVTRSQ